MRYILYILAFLLIGCEDAKQNRDYQLRIASLESFGKEEGLDFQISMISQSEYENALKEDTNSGLLSRYKGKPGTFSALNYNGGLGMVKSPYKTTNEDYEVTKKVAYSTLNPVLPQNKVYEIKLATDGSDVTSTLQEQIDSIPDGTPGNPNIIILPKGKFWTEGIKPKTYRDKVYITEISKRKNLIIEGTGTIFYTKAPDVPYGGDISKGQYSHRRHFGIVSSENITLNGLRIEGSNYTEGKLLGTLGNTPEFWKSTENDPDAWDGYSAYRSYWEFEHGFEIAGGSNIKLTNLEVYAVWGDGYYVGGDELGNPVDGVKLINCSTRWNGRQGFAAANNAKNVYVDGLIVDKSRRTAVDLEPHSKDGYIDGFTITNSKLVCQLTPFAAGGRGKIDNVLIQNNKYSGSFYSLFCRTSDPQDMIIRKNWKFIGNERIGTRGGDAIKLGWMDNVEIINNIDSYQGKYYVTALFVSNLTVKNNTTTGGKLLRLAGCEDFSVELPVLDNTAAIPAAELQNYIQMKLDNKL